MFCRVPSSCCGCLSLYAASKLVAAAHFPLAGVGFWIGSPASVLTGVLSFTLALLILFHEDVKVPRFKMLSSWLLVSLVNIFAVSFTSMWVLESVSKAGNASNSDVNVTIGVLSALSVLIIVMLGFGWIVVFSYYHELAHRYFLNSDTVASTDSPPRILNKIEGLW